MSLEIFNARMCASAGVFVVHEPHEHKFGTSMKVVTLPVLICSWWQHDTAFDIKYPERMVGIVQQSFQ